MTLGAGGFKIKQTYDMKKSYLKWGVLCLTALTVGCSDDKTEIDNPEGPQGSGSMQQLSPEESRQFLEGVAVGFMDMINPEEQRPIIELAAYYFAEYGTYTLPAEFIPGSEGGYTPTEYLRQIAEAAKGYIEGLTRAAATYSYTPAFAKYAGIYEPDASTHSWVKSADSQDIIFRFPDKSGQPVEMKVSQSAPMNVNASLTDNGTQLAATSFSGSLDEKKQTLAANMEASLMNIRTTTQVAGIDSKIESRSQVFVSNAPVATAYATIEGNGLCDRARYEALKDLEKDMLDDQIGEMFKKGYCGMDLAGKVQVYGQMEYYTRLPLDIAGAYGVWDENKAQMGQDACQQACDRLNKNVSAQIRYNNTATDQATILFRPAVKDFGYMTEYYPECVLLFPDGSRYTPAEYFSGFTSVAARFQTLVESYVAIWMQALQ